MLKLPAGTRVLSLWGRTVLSSGAAPRKCYVVHKAGKQKGEMRGIGLDWLSMASDTTDIRGRSDNFHFNIRKRFCFLFLFL